MHTNLYKILGESFVRQLEQHPHYCLTSPAVHTLDDIIKEVSISYKREQDRRRAMDHRESKAYKRWDREKNYSRKAFTRIGANYRPPTNSLRDPEHQNQFTFSQKRIHQLFMGQWAPIYCKHSRAPPDIGQFAQRYSDFMPQTDKLDGLLIDGADLHMQAQRIGQSGTASTGGQSRLSSCSPGSSGRTGSRLSASHTNLRPYPPHTTMHPT